ncbi:MAG: glycosyltransferase family 2 protein [Chitinophagaceae bacterium]|nr:glycosyltransferase family 2 protein [Chitinophagaceae bacterium]MCA6455104.1 glycosyltransferase family 2 protein [Chitinophagaceae bacterium]MCA6458816.1 glycosyltransferase family 2 protein [Chitinophagaceae bacterium]MCA6464324.1 glycosyltransferase family 2 protein [Chitinophagaceae bacterium]
MKKKVAFLIPVCNEENNIPVLISSLRNEMYNSGYVYTFNFIDDGSSDKTLAVLKEAAASHTDVFFISLSRNFGHQNALKAGIDQVEADCTIMMDGDLQHPPSYVPRLLAKWEEGNDIVYTIRKDHKEIAMMKRKTSSLFYQVINNLSDIELEEGTADFRLLDRKVINLLRNLNESDIFLRGLVKWIGFTQSGIEYIPGIRTAGTTKYTLKRMIRFALQGITSFSIKPLYIAVYLGFLFSLVALLYLPYVFYSYYFEHTISGWASLIATIAFFAGIQLMILGIIGIYIGKVFIQSKQRPHYIIKESNLPA